MEIKYQELIDIGTLLLQLGIYAKEYSERFLARCPNVSHRDSTPSWTIYKNSGFHRCFSCGFEGSLNYLVKYMTGKSIWEYCQIGQPENYLFKMSLEQSRYKLKQKEVKELNRGGFIYQSIGDLYSVYSNESVVNFLLRRKVHPDFINNFDIKYCKEACFNDRVYKNRILIPIYEDNRMISIEGRDYTGLQEPKVLYPKGASVNTLFNLSNLNKNEPLIVVEGIMDVHKIWTHFTKNVTCTFGINLTARQVWLLSQFSKVIIIPDNDDAGKEMIKKYDDLLDQVCISNSDSDKEFYVAVLPVRRIKKINSNNKDVVSVFPKDVVSVFPKDVGEASIKDIEEALRNEKTGARYFMENNNIGNSYDDNNITWG